MWCRSSSMRSTPILVHSSLFVSCLVWVECEWEGWVSQHLVTYSKNEVEIEMLLHVSGSSVPKRSHQSITPWMIILAELDGRQTRVHWLYFRFGTVLDRVFLGNGEKKTGHSVCQVPSVSTRAIPKATVLLLEGWAVRVSREVCSFSFCCGKSTIYCSWSEPLLLTTEVSFVCTLCLVKDFVLNRHWKYLAVTTPGMLRAEPFPDCQSHPPPPIGGCMPETKTLIRK